MNIEANIWWNPNDDGEGESTDGDVVVEVSEAESIILHFRVNGEVIANAQLNRLTAGVLCGQLMGAAVEAIA